jgi:ATP-dependent RNA helicase DeaD
MVAHRVRRQQKPAALARLLEVEAPEAALVFCRTRDNVDTLTEELARRGHRAEGLHGGLSQAQRDRVMSRLRAGTVDVVLATDVAARGLDVEHLTHVFNVDMPEAPEPFVHRVGRVGRAGREGVAISFVEPNQRRLVVDIERRMGMPILREPLPTAADQRAKRRSRLVERVRHMAAQADLDAWKELVEQLSTDLPIEDVAAAALRALADVTTADAPIEDIPDVGARRRPEGRPDHAPAARRGPPQRWGRVFLNVGREAGVRPQDLFGAILGETQLERGDVGSIEIRARFAVVEVPEGAVEHVCDRMSQATLRGRPVHARPDGQQGR